MVGLDCTERARLYQNCRVMTRMDRVEIRRLVGLDRIKKGVLVGLDRTKIRKCQKGEIIPELQSDSRIGLCQNWKTSRISPY